MRYQDHFKNFEDAESTALPGLFLSSSYYTFFLFIYLLLAVPRVLQDLSSPTRESNPGHSCENTEY